MSSGGMVALLRTLLVVLMKPTQPGRALCDVSPSLRLHTTAISPAGLVRQVFDMHQV